MPFQRFLVGLLIGALGLPILLCVVFAVARLFYVLVPVWTVFVLATDRLEQGAVLLTPLAVLFVPVTLAGVAEVVRTPRALSAPRV